jgi:hypothetical protein
MQKATFGQVEHVGNGSARDEGEDVASELGCCPFHYGRGLALLLLVKPSIDLSCLLKISSPNAPFGSFGGGEFCLFMTASSAADPDDGEKPFELPGIKRDN